MKVTPVSIAIDLVITAVVFFLFQIWFAGHVPSDDPTAVALVSAYTALPAACTFWLCLQMFKVTLAHQRATRRK